MKWDERGRFLGEICKECHPEEFAEAFHESSYLRIVPGHEAFPTKFRKNNDGIYLMTDSAAQDLAGAWDKGPNAHLEDEKRANRRTTPLTKEEIAKAQTWGNECLRQKLQPRVN